jgi:hypothetical protein
MNADMSPDLFRAVLSIQQQIHRDNGGLRTDVHYQEGYGALVVPEGRSLHPANVILVISEPELQIRSHFF